MCLYAGRSFNHFFQRCLWCLLHSGNRFKSKTHFQGKPMVLGAPFRAECNLSHVCNFRGQCIISAGVAPHYLDVILDSSHKFCFLRTAWSGGMAFVFADTSVSQKLSTSWDRLWEGGTAGTTAKLLCLFKGALFLHLVKKKKKYTNPFVWLKMDDIALRGPSKCHQPWRYTYLLFFTLFWGCWYVSKDLICTADLLLCEWWGQYMWGLKKKDVLVLSIFSVFIWTNP